MAGQVARLVDGQQIVVFKQDAEAAVHLGFRLAGDLIFEPVFPAEHGTRKGRTPIVQHLSGSDPFPPLLPVVVGEPPGQIFKNGFADALGTHGRGGPAFHRPSTDIGAVSGLLCVSEFSIVRIRQSILHKRAAETMKIERQQPMMTQPELPIEPVIPEIQKTLRDHPGAVLQAPPAPARPPGYPLALLGAAWLKGRKILLLEPRRLAARAAAGRMAALLDQPVGRMVGYRSGWTGGSAPAPA